MAKLSQVLRDERRKKLIAKYAEKRAELRKRLKDANVSIEEKFQIQEEFAKLPRNSCPTRKNNRCRISGRSRSYYRRSLGGTKGLPPHQPAGKCAEYEDQEYRRFRGQGASRGTCA